MPPIIVFCEDPLTSSRPDSMYDAEVAACEALGLDYVVINFEALVDAKRPDKAVRHVTEMEMPSVGIYRGWMLRPEFYQQLFAALNAKGITLINSPAAYKHTHHLPETYPVIKDFTPETVWLRVDGDVSVDAIMDLLAPFGSDAIILKDYVKSQKHYWQEACFIPSAADRQIVERVVKRFMELQGTGLNEGLVFRRFVELEPLTAHSKSGMPLTKEFRMFVLDGTPMFVTEYWEEGDYQGLSLPTERFRNVMQQVQSRFYTMDVAQKRDQQWMITELGDAQVAGLPDKADPISFYKNLLTITS